MSYTDTATVKAYLHITETTDDTIIATKCTQAQAIIDGLLGFTFEASADSTHYFRTNEDVIDDRDLLLDNFLCTITSVINGDSETMTQGTDFVTEPRNRTPYYMLRLKQNYIHWWGSWTQEIAVTGKWAWSETPPADIQQAATRLAAWLYKMRDSQVFDVVGMTQTGLLQISHKLPTDVMAIIDNYRDLTP